MINRIKDKVFEEWGDHCVYANYNGEDIMITTTEQELELKNKLRTLLGEDWYNTYFTKDIPKNWQKNGI